MSKEIRAFEGTGLSNTEGRTISAYGIVFNRESRQMQSFSGKKFVEIIRPEAVNGLLEDPDIRVYLNHNYDKVLARNNGSLKLSVDSTGVKYEFEVPDTSYGNDLLENVKRGIVDKSSFGFTIDYEDDSAERVTKREDDLYVREILKFERIIEVSPLTSVEAYPDTSVKIRSIYKAGNEEEEKKQAIEIRNRDKEKWEFNKRRRNV